MTDPAVAAIDAARAERDRLRSSLDRVSGERDRLREELDRALTRIRSLEAEWDSLDDECERLRVKARNVVLVCSACGTEACADGVLMCDDARTASFRYRAAKPTPTEGDPS